MPRTPARLREALAKVPLQLWLAVLVLAAAGASALLSGPGRIGADPAGEAAGPADPPSPSLAVEEALAAARRGDVDAYLSQFTGALRAELTGTRRDKGDAYFRSYLERLAGPVKGLAVDLTRGEESTPGTLRLPVEVVYADRSEVQRYFLRREGAAGQWRIAGVERARSAPTLIPYGTPVVPEAAAPQAAPGR